MAIYVHKIHWLSRKWKHLFAVHGILYWINVFPMSATWYSTLLGHMCCFYFITRIKQVSNTNNFFSSILNNLGHSSLESKPIKLTAMSVPQVALVLFGGFRLLLVPRRSVTHPNAGTSCTWGGLAQSVVQLAVVHIRRVGGSLFSSHQYLAACQRVTGHDTEPRTPCA